MTDQLRHPNIRSLYQSQSEVKGPASTFLRGRQLSHARLLGLRFCNASETQANVACQATNSVSVSNRD